MKIVTPDYYKKFKCNPENCKHNCCCEWEIDIDEATIEKYKRIKGEFTKKFNAAIYSDDDGFHFRLNADKRCPFLNDNNLCTIILELGEDMLCQICSDHPRYRNFYSEYIEVGLGLCCEEAGRLILNQSSSAYMISDEEFHNEFFTHKNSLLETLNKKNETIRQKIITLFSLCEADFDLLDYDKWVDIYLNLEVLDNSWIHLLENSYDCFCDNTYPEWELQFANLLNYFIMRYYTNCEVKETLIFSAVSVYMIFNIFFSSADLSMDNLIEISRMYSSEIEYSQVNIDDLIFEIDINLMR